MKKSYFQKTIDHLNSTRNDKLLELSLLPFDRLHALKKEYWELYKGAEEFGYTEAMEVNRLKLSIIDEAIRIKTGNEEQAWDYLT